jgi:lambda family phage minor tail protein L
MSLNSTVASEIQKLAPNAVVELFELDATSLGGDVLRFHAGTNSLSANVVWDGETYTRFPIQVSGFDITAGGQFPRPRVKVSNALSAITAVLLQYSDLLGTKFTRIRTFARYLDAVNFSGGVNPSADPNVEFRRDIFYVERKVSENRDMVEFELVSSADVAGVKLPRRQIIQNTCVWKYRGTECGYTGGPLFDRDGIQLVSKPSRSTEANNLLDAYETLRLARLDFAAKTTTLANTSQTKSGSCEMKRDYQGMVPTSWSTTGSDYTYAVLVCVNTGKKIPAGATFAIYGGNFVALDGSTYRIGRKIDGYKYVRLDVSGTPWYNKVQAELRRQGFYAAMNPTGLYEISYDLYEIEHWAVDSAQCTIDSGTYTTALSAYNTAGATLNTATSAFNSALAALPSGDDLYDEDICGKKLSSCKARFGENNPLPYGSFPAAGLTK